MPETPYTPPKVWTWDADNGGAFAHINQPIAGPTHTAELPRGKHPFQLYSLGTPNGQKVTILFEELLELSIQEAEYDAWLVEITEGGQFSSGFVDVNPNSKIPALLDYSNGNPIRIFESGAILMHLAEKFDQFLPHNPNGRAECLSWLMWQMSTAPILGGGFGHFFYYAPERWEYPINRFAMEAKRIFDVADRRLAESQYFAGDTYSIADIAIYGWLGVFHRTDPYNGGSTFLDFSSYKNIQRWAEELTARPAVQRGFRVNRTGEGELRERHSPLDFEKLSSKA